MCSSLGLKTKIAIERDLRVQEKTLASNGGTEAVAEKKRLKLPIRTDRTEKDPPWES